MRKSDFLRQIGSIKNTQDRVNSVVKNPVSIQKTSTELQTGTAIVTSAVRNGNGSLCDIEILSSGVASGLRCQNCRSNTALKIGDKVSFYRKADGTVELSGGGGSVSTTTTPSTTTTTFTLHGHNSLSDGGYLGGSVSGGL